MLQRYAKLLRLDQLIAINLVHRYGIIEIVVKHRERMLKILRDKSSCVPAADVKPNVTNNITNITYKICACILNPFVI